MGIENSALNAFSADFALYVLAKYDPDPARMESRNIGLFVWSPGEVDAKFLSLETAGLFVEDLRMYERWIEFWLRKTSEPELTHKNRTTAKTSAHYIDGLLATQKGSYRLIRGSQTLTMPPSGITALTNELFDRLVRPPTRALRFAEPPSDRYALV